MGESLDDWDYWRVTAGRNGSLAQNMDLLVALAHMPQGLQIERHAWTGLIIRRGHHTYQLELEFNIHGVLCGKMLWTYPSPRWGYSHDVERWWGLNATVDGMCARLALWLEWQETYGRPAQTWEDARRRHE